MLPSDICLSAVLVLTLIVAAYFALRAARLWWPALRGADRFTYATPATPRSREAAADLFGELERMVGLSYEFETRAASPAFAGWASIALARRGVAQTAAVLERASKQLSGSPPTYANYIAVYTGLAGSDQALASAAKAYRVVGLQCLSEDGQGPKDATLGNVLLSMGQQSRAVGVGIHRLGVALDVE